MLGNGSRREEAAEEPEVELGWLPEAAGQA